MGPAVSDDELRTIRRHLEEQLPRLRGEWVAKNSGYERGLCEVIGWKCEHNRYWDAVFGNSRIEIKKGRSVWLDLVRYSELLVSTKGELSTATVFFIPDEEKLRIVRVLGVRTAALIDKLHLGTDGAAHLLALKETVPRSLNAQASLTIKDISGFCDFDISLGG